MRKIFSILFVIVCIVVIVLLYIEFSFGHGENVSVNLDRCVDGDTAWFLIDGKSVKVRFLGIDTPEIHQENNEFGLSAKEYTCKKLEEASSIYLEYDLKSDRYDKYGRLLAWVFVDDNNLSKLLVLNGYAMVRYIYDDYIYVDELCDVQKDAWKKGLGIWKEMEEDYYNNYCYKKK